MCRLLFAFLLFLVSLSAIGEIFKCVKGKGEIVYQNFECKLDTIGSAATAPPGGPAQPAPRTGDQAPVAKALPSAPAVGAKAPDAAQQFAADGNAQKYEPRVGMTKRQVRRLSWGEPEDIKPAEGGEIWTYAKNRSVRFGENGRVVAVQQ
jgi:hypothetical protein